jgi:hypothetical protein
MYLSISFIVLKGIGFSHVFAVFWRDARGAAQAKPANPDIDSRRSAP